jgi:pimeloyl-ACP methyl ester carboxylesterase
MSSGEGKQVGLGLAEGVEECWMDLDGARMRYLRSGSGPPLILLHGLLAYSFSWRFTLPALAPFATIYALDQLGAGFSDRPPHLDHSMQATALRVLKFAENLGLSSFDLLGTSRGGAVAMCAAAESLSREGPRVRRLILVCPVNPYSPHGTWLAPFLGTPFGAAGFRYVTARMPSLFSYGHGRLYADPSKIPADSLQGYEAPLMTPGFFEHGLSIVKTWTADLKQLQQLLPKLRDIPTLLVWGDKDPAVYISSMEPLARNFAQVKKVVFHGIGHLPYEECPAQFNQALVEFLTQ